MAKPSLYTPEVAEAILSRIAEGEPLNWICRDPGMPAPRTVRDWRKNIAGFEDLYRDARDAGFDAIASRARLTLRGEKGELGGESTGDIARDKAIAEFDLKLLAKWDPRRYGDSLALKHSGHLTLEQLVQQSQTGGNPGE